MPKRIPKRTVPSETVEHYWRISLLLGVGIIGAVALLLQLLVSTAQQIEQGAAEIWRVGKLIANNTVHIALLLRTNQIVHAITQRAEGIARATERIQRVATRTTR